MRNRKVNLKTIWVELADCQPKKITSYWILFQSPFCARVMLAKGSLKAIFYVLDKPAGPFDVPEMNRAGMIHIDDANPGPHDTARKADILFGHELGELYLCDRETLFEPNQSGT